MFRRFFFRTMLVVVAAVALISFLVAPANTPGQRWTFRSRPDKTVKAPPASGMDNVAKEPGAAPAMAEVGQQATRGSSNLFRPSSSSTGSSTSSSSATGGSTGFYADYRVERESNRSAEMEMLQSLIDNPNTTPMIKQDAQQKLLKLISLSESELQLENLLKAEGYSDALVFLQGDSLTIIISGRAINETSATRIGDLATRATGIPLPKIVIVEKK